MATKAEHPTGTFVAWEGRSPFTGDPVVLIITPQSRNEKTGPMAQAWLLLRDVSPFDAVKSKKDAAICGGCVRRGLDAERRSCYVNLFNGPTRIWTAYRDGSYPTLNIGAAGRRLRGLHLRLTAYGDPAVLPLRIWQNLLREVAGWTGYTHLWNWCDPGFRKLFMASVDTDAEQALAVAGGWRTFRARLPDQPVHPWEIVCPASDEGGKRTTCVACRLCRGQGRPGAKSITIIEHGKVLHTRSSNDYTALRDELNRNGVAVVKGTQRERWRIMLAMKQYYRRNALPLKLKTKMGQGEFTIRQVPA